MTTTNDRSSAGAAVAETVQASKAMPAKGSIFIRLLARPEVSAVVMLVTVLAGFEVYTGGVFLSSLNIRILLQVIPELGIVAVGATILMIAGEFDLSVGSVFALTAMIMHVLSAQYGFDPWIAIAISLACACLIGYVNGIVTLGLSIPSFITTLGMLFIARSLAIVIYDFPLPLAHGMPTNLFAYDFGYFRASLLWYLGILLVLGILLHRTDFGNWIFAAGGHSQAASDLGINVRKVKVTAFVLCSFLAGFAGIIQVLRTKAPIPSMGDGLELEAIAAGVIGGTALTGGVGSVIGPLVGAILIRSVDNGLVMSRVPGEWFRTALGIMIVVAVILNVFVRRFAHFGRRWG